jgi:hypothetical protein
MNKGQITNYFNDDFFGKVSESYHGALAKDKDFLWVAMLPVFETFHLLSSTTTTNIADGNSNQRYIIVSRGPCILKQNLQQESSHFQ